MSGSQNKRLSTTFWMSPISVIEPGSSARISTPFLLSALNLPWNSADKWSQNGIARLRKYYSLGDVLGAFALWFADFRVDTGVPRSVAKRVASLNHILNSSSTSCLITAMRSLVWSMIPYAWYISKSLYWSLEALDRTFSKAFFATINDMIVWNELRLDNNPCRFILLSWSQLAFHVSS